ncbi:unnamed protein product [Dibothriocephalus latus]|uniref:Uncharacterized protein n=1 Tax=Dibothriocephalus latus TaxID=60516 RepID=A0A3P7LLI0_DIBLA|nr:unnamed protein product [Dibothriocephalus latus]
MPHLPRQRQIRFPRVCCHLSLLRSAGHLLPFHQSR